ncbi:MAG: SipW-dependent-type signal peptide-containing protein [Erysipelotrichaceae bacterium]|nr:SipW-dependent-type signal peptide-containing protein [Erysipelotrichaceae bacterium]
MKQKKQKYDINNIFYGVIGIATLMIAIIGATFAYFTATQTNNNTITGNMATINFDVSVTKMTTVDETKGGLIPMSNNMMEQALASSNGICVDNNGNAVCQVYKITVVNTSTASMFVDGYVSLTGGSGTPEDYPTYQYNTAKTTMRWAQAFCSTEAAGKVTACTTAGNSTVRASSTISMSALGGSSTQNSGLNTAEIKNNPADVTGTASISGNNYTVINKNYIRVSDHAIGNTAYTRATDITSALVYSQYLDANDNNAGNNTGTSSSTFTDAQVYYIVVWLSENGHNQTSGATGAATNAIDFFQGNVTFISAQGSEVTATFSGHTRVTPNT